MHLIQKKICSFIGQLFQTVLPWRKVILHMFYEHMYIFFPFAEIFA